MVKESASHKRITRNSDHDRGRLRKRKVFFIILSLLILLCIQAIGIVRWQSHELFSFLNHAQHKTAANPIIRNQTNTNPSSSSSSSSSNDRMNVLLLYADDWRFDTLGAAGNAVVKTPVLDQLAREGIRFTENCVTTSVCWCSRATLWTGLYTARHKTFRPRDFFVPWNETIYSLFQTAGYHVGHVGKWGVWHDYGKTLDYNRPDEGWHKRVIGKREIHITEKNTADALRFLRRTTDKEKPFFLVTSFFATHAVDGDKRQYLPQNSSLSLYQNDTIPIPKTATDRHWKQLPRPVFSEKNEGRIRWRWRFDTPSKHQHMMKNYYRMATEVDTACGAILQELQTQGQLNNTLIVFTTDNGNFHAEHGLADKWYPYQESIKVPLIIVDPRMPSHFHGTTNDKFTLNIDLAPTLLNAAGIPPLPQMMGRDIAQLYLNTPTTTADWRTDFFYEHPIHRSKESIPGSEALVTKDYKYIYWPDYNKEQLFHIPTDPYEEHDIIRNTFQPNAEHAQVLHSLQTRFHHLKHMVQNTTQNIIL